MNRIMLVQPNHCFPGINTHKLILFVHFYDFKYSDNVRPYQSKPQLI